MNATTTETPNQEATMYPFLDTPKDRRARYAETLDIIQDFAAATLITVSLYLGGMYVLGIIDLTK